MTWDRGKWQCVKTLEETGVDFVLPLSSSGYEAPDVFWAVDGRRFVGEVKTSRSQRIYINKEQITGLCRCAVYMAGMPLVIPKFIGTRKGFHVLHPWDLRETEKNLVVDMDSYLEAPKLSRSPHV